jgi:hypothetical protein
MTPDDLKFLSEVASRSQDPEMMRSIINSALGGVEHNARQARARAADMEVVAAMAMNARLFKGNANFLAQKLEAWGGKTSLRWDDQIKALKENTHGT